VLSEPLPEQSRIIANLLQFGRLLRLSGMPVGSQQIAELAQALACLDLSRREDVYQACRSILVKDVAQFDVFEQVFNLFWLQSLEWLFELNQVVNPAHSQQEQNELPESDQAQTGRMRRLPEEAASEGQEAAFEDDVHGAYSPLESLWEKDFRELTQVELRAAKQIIKNLIFRFEQRSTRRKVRALKRAEYLDFRRIFRQNLRYGGEIIEIAWSERKRKPRPVVVLCDISGSMARYSQLFLHFMYALVQQKGQIEAFVFGTRLTYVTPALRYHAVGEVIRQMSGAVMDWSGGTRIGASLREFNFKWSRRMLRRGAVVILISDGWDRGNTDLLKQEMARLRRTGYGLVWLNPLAGEPGYEPLVKGMQAALPYVDYHLPLNNLRNLQALVDRLQDMDGRRGGGRTQGMSPPSPAITIRR
jgi:hypothetical protein